MAGRLGRVVVLDEASASSCSTVAELAERCAGLEVRQLWMSGRLVAALGLPAVAPAMDRRVGLAHEWAASTGPWTKTPAGLAPWSRVSRDGVGFDLVIPDYDRGGPWAGLDASTLAGELRRFGETVGVPWWRSGALTSDSLLRSLHRRGIMPQRTDAPPITGVEANVFWRREPEGPELRARWCHAFDVNGMYLSAASSLPLPTGPVVYTSATAEALRRGRPGWWLVGDEWVSTPTALYRGGHEATEGWYWPESHRYLEPWYRRLRDARADLLAGRGRALDAVKQVYRAGIGRLASPRRASLDDPLYQPYWQAAVVAEARCRMMRRLDGLGQRPVAIDVDAAYFLTSTADPARFGALIGLPMGDGLGQWKPHLTMPAAEVRRHLALPTARALSNLRGGQ